MSASSKSTKAESVFISNNHSKEAFRVLHEMRGNMEHCDITLKAGNLSLHAHQVVLAALSPYFRQVFSPENIEQQQTEYHMPDHLNPQAITTMIEFFYTGNLQISFKNVEDLLTAASLLKNQEALDAIMGVAMSDLRPSNSLRLQEVAKRHDLPEMKNKIGRFIEWNFKYLSKEPGFLELEEDHLKEIISSENLRVKREEIVYEAVLRWYKHDPTNRKEAVEGIFQEVRFCQIPKNSLTKQIIPELVEKEQLCAELIEQAMSHHKDPGKNPGRPRKPLESIYIISKKDNMAERFDPVHCACVPCYSMVPVDDENEGEYRCAVVISQDLYAVYGSRVEKFDPVGLCWQEVGPGMDTRDTGVCASKDSIYVVGGRTNGQGAHKYSIKSSSWSALPDMSESRRLPGVAFLTNKLYVIGGYGTNGPLASTECYSTKQDKWTALKAMKTARFQFGVGIQDGSIFVLGGRDNVTSLDTVEVYDTKSKAWKTIDANMKEARNDFGVVSQNSVIYCFGGRGVNSIECYDIVNKEWKTVGNTGENNFSIDCVLFPPI